MTGDFRKVLITGATGAIGGALARHYAAPGCHLVLQGRDETALARIAAECRQAGAEVDEVRLDLSDIDALTAWLEQVCETAVPDLVFANAGININNGADQAGEHWHEMDALIDLNIRSTLALGNHVAKRMRSRGEGHLVLISSLAGYFGLPVTPSYSASKAAVKAYGEGIRGWLAGSGVNVSVVMPGYVSSKMCHEMPGPKPFLWTPERAAKVIARGVSRNSPRISFPFPLNWGCWWLAVLPARLSLSIVRWMGY